MGLAICHRESNSRTFCNPCRRVQRVEVMCMKCSGACSVIERILFQADRQLQCPEYSTSLLLCDEKAVSAERTDSLRVAGRNLNEKQTSRHGEPLLSPGTHSTQGATPLSQHHLVIRQRGRRGCSQASAAGRSHRFGRTGPRHPRERRLGRGGRREKEEKQRRRD
jgi:hypothetical protein